MRSIPLETVATCEFGLFPNPQVAMASLRIKPVVIQVKPTLTFHPSGAAENTQNLSQTRVKNFACGFGLLHLA